MTRSKRAVKHTGLVRVERWAVGLAVAGVVLTLAVGWFFTLPTFRQQGQLRARLADTQRQVALSQQQMAAARSGGDAQQRYLSGLLSSAHKLDAQLPGAAPDIAALASDVQHMAVRSGATLVRLDPANAGAPASPAPGAGAAGAAAAQETFSVEVTGSWSQVTAFVAAVHSYATLLTLTGVNVTTGTGPAVPGAAAPQVDFHATLSAWWSPAPPLGAPQGSTAPAPQPVPSVSPPPARSASPGARH